MDVFCSLLNLEEFVQMAKQTSKYPSRLHSQWTKTKNAHSAFTFASVYHVRILARGAELINQVITKTTRNSYTGVSLFYVESPTPQESVMSNLILQSVRVISVVPDTSVTNEIHSDRLYSINVLAAKRRNKSFV